MLTDKRTRAEAILVLQSLRNKHARLAEQRSRKIRRKARDERHLNEAWSGAHRGQYEELGELSAVHGSRAFLAVARRNKAAARTVTNRGAPAPLPLFRPLSWGNTAPPQASRRAARRSSGTRWPSTRSCTGRRTSSGASASTTFTA